MRTVSDVLAALALPAQARLDKRVPKKLLVEQGAFVPSDKRKVQDGVDELVWVAALKPSNIAVAEYHDAVREYLEIAVLSVVIKPEVTKARLIELIHRTIPYPVVLVSEQSGTIDLSLAHKRASEGEAGKVVLDGDIVSVSIGDAAAVEKDFLGSLSAAAQPSGNLFLLYQGWMDKLTAFKVAQITGGFVTTGDASGRLVSFKEYETIQDRLKDLRGLAMKERQISRRVELNLEVQQLETRLKQLVETLKR